MVPLLLLPDSGALLVVWPDGRAVHRTERKRHRGGSDSGDGAGDAAFVLW
ncbi:MAG: hypothetical protein LT106_13155 [Burkholderiaceae bacterium]|nr:hypothetical protein [Burkholderiaceae bacterium]